MYLILQSALTSEDTLSLETDLCYESGLVESKRGLAYRATSVIYARSHSPASNVIRWCAVWASDGLECVQADALWRPRHLRHGSTWRSKPSSSSTLALDARDLLSCKGGCSAACKPRQTIDRVVTSIEGNLLCSGSTWTIKRSFRRQAKKRLCPSTITVYHGSLPSERQTKQRKSVCVRNATLKKTNACSSHIQRTRLLCSPAGARKVRAMTCIDRRYQINASCLPRESRGFADNIRRADRSSTNLPSRKYNLGASGTPTIIARRANVRIE